MGAAVLLAVVAVAVAVAAWALLSRRRLASEVGELERETALLRNECAATVAEANQVEQVLAAVPQGVVVYDEDGEVRWRNERASVYVGTRHGEALAAKAVDEMVELAFRGEPSTQTLELYGPPRRTLTITARPLVQLNEPVGAVVVVEDVTSTRRLEAMRRDFVANMSHELKTPVGALGLLAETTASEDDPAVVQSLVRRMQDEAFRVSRIIEDLLDLSRIEAEEHPVREPVPVHLVVADAVDGVRPVADHQGIDIEVDDVPRGMAVLGDRRQLVSAVQNLLENAVKYSDEGSAVEVHVSAGARGQVELSVCDHGIGIPSRDLERIFERFYRVDRARSRTTGGTGLGLAIVRHVVRNHHGEIVVESQEGEGSTFTLRLPSAWSMTTPRMEAG